MKIFRSLIRSWSARYKALQFVLKKNENRAQHNYEPFWKLQGLLHWRHRAQCTIWLLQRVHHDVCPWGGLMLDLCRTQRGPELYVLFELRTGLPTRPRNPTLHHWSLNLFLRKPWTTSYSYSLFDLDQLVTRTTLPFKKSNKYGHRNSKRSRVS